MSRYPISDLPEDLQKSPVFSYHKDFLQLVIRFIWRMFSNGLSKFNVRYKTHGDWKKVYRENPRLLIISNHASHLDAASISGTIPFSMWRTLYITAAKDYFFNNKLMRFFSRYCLAAIPMDRHDRKKDSVQMILTLLSSMSRVWLIIFPEGTRSKTGKIGTFKKGISIFANETNTPILFVYIKGNKALWPKGAWLPRPGLLNLYIGPVQQPAPVEEIEANYKAWVMTIDPAVEFEEPSETLAPAQTPAQA